MTERLAEVTRRIENLHQLEAVVTAMQGIAASRAQQARSLLPGLRAHASVIGRAIGQALTLGPEPHRPMRAEGHRMASILFCAEQGFVGAFSDRMLEAALAGPRCDLFLVGTRGAMLAAERGPDVVWHAAMASHANLVPGLANKIAEALYGWVSEHTEHRVEMIVPAWTTSGGVIPERRSLLPFEFRRFAVRAESQPPLTTLPARILLERLAEEYVFAELCEAALTAFVAENEARAAVMMAAKSNLENKQSDLQMLERQLRQGEITAEVVELAGAAGAACWLKTSPIFSRGWAERA